MDSVKARRVENRNPKPDHPVPGWIMWAHGVELRVRVQNAHAFLPRNVLRNGRMPFRPSRLNQDQSRRDRRPEEWWKRDQKPQAAVPAAAAAAQRASTTRNPGSGGARNIAQSRRHNVHQRNGDVTTERRIAMFAATQTTARTVYKTARNRPPGVNTARNRHAANHPAQWNG